MSYQRLQTQQPLTDQELYDKIRRTAANKHELQVLESFLIFNKYVSLLYFIASRLTRLVRHVLKTNFYQPTKVALSFRLAPDFLPEVEYPKKPFGMFFVIGADICIHTWFLAVLNCVTLGNEFRGFHIRFRDVARGGIRIVRSRNREYVISLPHRNTNTHTFFQDVLHQPEATVSI